MAPSPEYDKEPKAPDKSATNISSEDTKLLHNLVTDQLNTSDHKTTNSATNSEVENNKHVETLDDEKLRALLNEALTYKCPKDREGKSSLFKELLEEVEQDDEQACEAAARTLTGCRGSRRGARGRRALPHSNSLQDLVAALAAEPTTRRHHTRHHQPTHAPSTVSARAIHGGSLPSGVDTSSLLSEEGSSRGTGAGYLATVRCVNPPPLAERRVSASDANAPHELEVLNRRSKPMFPMTYTARATLEIGSGSVCSGRAVTTTTASNQVRTPPHTPARLRRSRPPATAPRAPSRAVADAAREPSHGPPERRLRRLYEPDKSGNRNQRRLMDAICSKMNDHGGGKVDPGGTSAGDASPGKDGGPRGPTPHSDDHGALERGGNRHDTDDPAHTLNREQKKEDLDPRMFVNSVDMWYEGLAAYNRPLQKLFHDNSELKNFAIRDDSARPKYIPNSQSPEDCVVAPDLPANDNKYTEGHCSENYKNESLYFSNVYDIGQSYSAENAYSVAERSKSDRSKSDTRLSKEYREKVVKLHRRLTVPTIPSINPRNVRNMSIGKSLASFKNVDSKVVAEKATDHSSDPKDRDETTTEVVTSNPILQSDAKGPACDNITNNDTRVDIEIEISELMEDQKSKCFQMVDNQPPPADNAIGGKDSNALTPSSDNDIELEEIVCHRASEDNDGSFSDYVADQQKLFHVLEATDSSNVQDEYSIDVLERNNNVKPSKRSDSLELGRTFTAHDVSSENDINMNTNTETDTITTETKSCADAEADSTVSNEMVVQLNRKADEKATGDRYILAELPNNAYIFLTLPKRLLTPLNRDYRPSVELHEIESNNNTKPLPETKPKRRKDKPPVGTSSNVKKKDTINKNALRVLLFENLLKGDRGEKPSPGKAGPGAAVEEVDSAIPFSCITTPEVVASCNTTPSASHAAVSVDPKPQQLECGYRTAASPTGAGAAASAAAPRPQCAGDDDADEQPRSVIATSFNGLPLSRPNYGSTAATTSEDYKKSLDENGNAVQGYSSPLSGSSQHKKPRRKKSSKNETVIDCRQIDGYQGDKDVNELLRFIESNAESRAPKLRAKHDADDKAGKKRSTERRKDKDSKVKRASSLEERSRTTLEDLTAAGPRPARAAHAPAKPERRSWGDAATAASPPPPPPAPEPVVEQADFQTVTKKRKPRRRTDEPPRRARAPSPRRQESAPPSDRSNDSNDDMDSVHSLPAQPPVPAAPPPPHASYADIARTRNNIPDLIESCNFYAEGEGGADPRRQPPPPPPPPPPEVDGYPALETRTAVEPAPLTSVRRTNKPAAAAVRRERKERPAPPAALPQPPECPAPDVVADRRPPVILLDSAARPGDMDGVTFGFDINEQLLGGGARRPRCDLVRDAVEPRAAAPPPGAAPATPGGVPVTAGCAALRYVPPDPPPDTHHLHQIIDYVGAAWEDVLRCGGGKLRYFSE